MDPAYLVWIPPLDGGDILQEIEDADERYEDDEPQYEEILPNYSNINVDPGSNVETASEDEAPHLPPLNTGTAVKQQNSEQTKNQRNTVISKVIAANLLSSDISLDITSSNGDSSTSRVSTESDLIPLHDLSGGSTSTLCNKFESPARVHRRIPQKAPSEEEKETAVVKSPEATRGSLDDLDDIQFADDEEDDDVSFDNRNATLKLVPLGLSNNSRQNNTSLASAKRIL